MPRPLRTPPRRYVLDTNAMVGFFEDRAAVADKVEQLLQSALSLDPLLISAVNWGGGLLHGMEIPGLSGAREAAARFEETPVTGIPADLDRATRAAALKQKHNLACADAFAAEPAIERAAWLVTVDPGFSQLGNIVKLYSLPRHES